MRNQNGAEFPVGSITGSDPELSPDGTKIAYGRYDAVQATDVVDVVDLSGNFLATLGSGREPTWSPDGTKIAFAKRGDPQTIGCGLASGKIELGNPRGLAVAPAIGGPSTWLIEPFKPKAGSDVDGDIYWQVSSKPNWAPDGSAIVLHGSETRVYSSDGLCVTENVGGVSNSDVFKVAATGGDPVNLTAGAPWIGASSDTEPADLNPSFSPDSKQIAFASSRNRPRDGGIHSLWKMNADGSDQKLVIRTQRTDGTDWMTALPVGDVVRIKALDACATEERKTPGTLAIERTGFTDGDVEVTLEVSASSTATSGSDFAPIPAKVTIPDGSSLVNLVVFPIDDDLPEPDETIEVEVVSAQGLIVGEPSRATITIADNDGGPPGGSCASVPNDACKKANARVAKLKGGLKKAKKRLGKAETSAKKAKKKAKNATGAKAKKAAKSVKSAKKAVKKAAGSVKKAKKSVKKAKQKAASACG